MNSHLTSIRMCIIKKKRLQMLTEVWRIVNPCILLEARKLVQSLWKVVWRFHKTLKRELHRDPATPLSNIYLKEAKSVS